MSLTPEELRARLTGCTRIEAQELADELERLQKELIEVKAHNEHVRIERVKSDDKLATYREVLIEVERALEKVFEAGDPFGTSTVRSCESALARIRALKLEE